MKEYFKKLYFKKINSTNEKAKEFAKKGIFNFVFVADEQTKGKGRFKRRWFSGKGGLYFSVLLKEENIGKIKYLTFIAAISIVKSVFGVTGLKTKIKWPNDVHSHKKKLCGILTENILGKVNCVIVGAGININQEKFPKSIKNNATSLKILLNTRENQRFSVSRKSSISVKKINKEKILNQFLKEFNKLYYQYKNKRYKAILYEFKKYCDTIGKDVKVKTIKSAFFGKVIGIDDDCNLVLKLKNKKIKKIIEGDILVLD